MSLRDISFQDADFPRRNAKCWSKLEGNHLRWIPYGMPRLNPNISKTVFFLYGLSPKDGKIKGPLATGFLVSSQEHTGTQGIKHIYAVTAAHNILKGACIIRLDGHADIDLEITDWELRDSRYDIAAIDVTDRIDTASDLAAVPVGLFAVQHFIRDVALGIGEDGFMLGLHSPEPEAKQHSVAARFGNISLMADPSAPIAHSDWPARPMHLFDMHSRAGFSGSPVFVYRTPGGDLRNLANGPPMPRMTPPQTMLHTDPNWSAFLDWQASKENQFLCLFGMHVAQHYDRVKALKGKAAATEADDLIRHKDDLHIPGSMTLVVPAWEIISLLEQPNFVAQRKARWMTKETTESELDHVAYDEVLMEDQAEPDADANPAHQEDFTRLVGAATRKKPQAD